MRPSTAGKTSADNLPRWLTPSASQMIRYALVGTGILMMFYATGVIGGCAAGNGKYTSERKNAAKARIDALKAQNEHQMGLQSLLAGNLDKAEKHADRAIILADNVSRNWVLKGRVKLEQSDLQQAEYAFKKAAELDKTDVDAVYFQGLLAERVMEREEALRLYTQAADMDMQNPQYSLAAAEMMIDLGRPDDAREYLESKQQVFRHTAGIQQTLGHIAMLQNDYPRAERHFSEARLLAPNENDVMEDLARAQFLSGNWGEAESSLSKLLRDGANKDRSDLAFMRARCLMNLDRNAEARDLLVELTRSDWGKNNPDAWIALGEAAHGLRDTARLRLSFARAIALAPERSEGYVLKGLHLKRLGDFEGAEREFRKAVERSATPENHLLLGLVQSRLDRLDAARQNFEAARNLDPANALAGALAAQPSRARELAGADE